MARKFQIDTPAQIGGLLEALSGITVTGNGSVSGTFSVGSTATITGKLTLTAGIAGALILDTQATGTTHAVRADRNITAGTGLTGGGNLTADRTLTVDFTASGGDNGVGTKVARNDHTHGTTYLGLTATAADSSKLGGIAASSYVQNTLQVIAGTGLTGGGTLAANRTLAVDFGTGTNQAARGDHNHDTTYAKLSGSSAFTGDITISKDSPSFKLNRTTGTGNPAIVVQDASVSKGAFVFDIANSRWKLTNNIVDYYDIIHSGGGQTISGALTVSGLMSLGTQATGTGHAVRADRTITAGTGLTGGGDLTANRTLAVDFGTGTNQVARGDHNHDATYLKLSGGTLTNTLVFAAGAGGPTFNVIGTATSWARGFTWKDTAGTNTSAGMGLYGTNSTINHMYLGFGVNPWDTATSKGIFIGTNGFVSINKLVSTTHALDVNGSANATTLYEGGTLLSSKYAPTGRTITAGNGLTGGGDLTANRTLTVNFTTSGGNNGTDTTVARGDHNHDGTYIKANGTANIAITGSFITTASHSFIAKQSGQKSWVMHRPTSSSLVFAPSATVDAEDWVWLKQISFLDTGGMKLLGPLNSAQNGGTVSFPPGVTSATLTHNFNSTNYRLAFGANNHARHVAWANKGVNTVDITIDSSHTETITVDVIIIPF